MWVNFAVDVLLAIGLGFDAPAPGLMRRRPRDASAPIVDRGLGIRLALASVRNLPERLAYELTTEQAAEMAEYKARRRAQQPDAMDAADVAGQVADAIREQRFYVITHPESRDAMRERFDRIVRGENPQPSPG